MQSVITVINLGFSIRRLIIIPSPNSITWTNSTICPQRRSRWSTWKFSCYKLISFQKNCVHFILQRFRTRTIYNQGCFVVRYIERYKLPYSFQKQIICTKCCFDPVQSIILNRYRQHRQQLRNFHFRKRFNNFIVLHKQTIWGDFDLVRTWERSRPRGVQRRRGNADPPRSWTWLWNIISGYQSWWHHWVNFPITMRRCYLNCGNICICTLQETWVRAYQVPVESSQRRMDTYRGLFITRHFCLFFRSRASDRSSNRT